MTYNKHLEAIYFFKTFFSAKIFNSMRNLTKLFQVHIQIIVYKKITIYFRSFTVLSERKVLFVCLVQDEQEHSRYYYLCSF